MLRLFTAIAIPTAIKKQIAAALTPYPAEKWIAAANWHVTVFFLGNTSPDNLPQLSQKLQAITRYTPPFTLQFKQVEARLQLGRAPMVWISFYPNESFTALASLIGEVSGKEPDYDFLPHLTLLRLPNIAKQDAKAKSLAKMHLPPFLLPVTQIELWQSEQSENRRIYTALQKFDLQG